MITRFYLEEYLSFKHVDIEFEKGLIVFTGPSGAGKSILMDAFLALFGLKDAKANKSETILENMQLENEAYDIEPDDDIVIREIKKDKVRFFLNNQTISKKALISFSKNLVKHLHLRDTSDFESERLIGFLDTLCVQNDKDFSALKSEYETTFTEYHVVKKELQKLHDDEAKLEELKEFAHYEIEKIASLDPQVDEYEELDELKRRLSKKDKIEEAINLAKPIFEYTAQVSKALELLEKDSSSFHESINDLENSFESFSDSLYELEELDIEAVLDRIEKLSSLQKRFGSIQEALDYKKEKEKELEGYDNISFEKVILEKKDKKLLESLNILSSKLTKKRTISIRLLEEKINGYLKYLYLSNATMSLENKVLDNTGSDSVYFELNGVNLDTISSGEFNRLRLALLTSMSHFEMGKGGVLFLDEIDANLSGKESNAIATVLKELSKTYQIFAISHQPQLTATASQHFLVDKINGESSVKLLDKEEKVNEISRMISGEDISKEAYEFAKNLLNPKN